MVQGKACPDALASEYLRQLQAIAVLKNQLLYPDINPLRLATQPVLRAGIGQLVSTANTAADKLGLLADGIAIGIDNELQDSIASKGVRNDYAGVAADTELASLLLRARERVQPMLQDWGQRWRAKAQSASAIGQNLPGNTPDMRRRLQHHLDKFEIRMLNSQNLAAEIKCQLPLAPAAGPVGRPESVLLGLYPPLDLNVPLPVASISKADMVAMSLLGFWLTQREFGDFDVLTPAAAGLAEEQGTTINATLKGGGPGGAIKTPEATIEPDGTSFLVHRDAQHQATFVYVGDGSVLLTPQRGATIRVRAGQVALVTFRGARLVVPRDSSTGGGPVSNPLFEIDTNRSGSDYASFDLPRAEPQQCLDRCKGDNRCLAWTYVKPGVQGANARCYLKSPAPPATANNCCISGTFTRILDGGAQMEVDTNRQGSDFANIEMQVAVPQLCYERCKGDSRCAAWTFVKPGVQGPKARCYLKNPAPAPTPNTCCVSGVMTGVAPPPTAPATLPGGDVRYDNPALNGVLVDHCASWGANCGQGGADQFCRRQGHGPARSFQVRNPGRTVVLADNQICEGGNCVGFTQVVCVGSGQVSPPSPPVPPPVQPPPPPPPQPPGASCWLTSPTFLETGEHQWEGVYVRRGSSNVFDVTYTKGSQVDRGELTLDLVSPTEVRIHRTRSQNGYTAVFGARIETESLARGMYPGGTRFDLRCTSTSLRSGVVPPPVTPLSPPRPPVIEALGDVWNEFEGSERAIWTRRPGSNTFDASWSNGRVRAVLEMSLNGNQVTIRRSQSTDGYECVYTGTLQGREASGTFGCNRFSGQLPWRATIDGGGTGTATAPTGAPRLLGCFRDPNSPFDLDGHLGRSAQNTPQSCINTCANLGFKFAGVQYSESCLCGNSYGRFGPANNCNMPCTGDSNQICGGGNANSVYSTGVTTSPTTGPVAPEVRTPPQPPAPPAPPPPPRPPAGAFVLKLQSTAQDPSNAQWGVSNGRITYTGYSGDYRATGLYTWNPPPSLIGPEGFTLSLVAQCETGRLQGGGFATGAAVSGNVDFLVSATDRRKAATDAPTHCVGAGQNVRKAITVHIVPKEGYREGEVVTLKVSIAFAGGVTYSYVATRQR